MSKNNKLSLRAPSMRHKEILEEAAEKHYTGSLSGFTKQWIVVICKLVQAGISADWMIANIDKVIRLCNFDHK